MTLTGFLDARPVHRTCGFGSYSDLTLFYRLGVDAPPRVEVHT
jgi:hypothetical protein